MLELIVMLVALPVAIMLVMIVAAVMNAAVFAPFILFDRLLERLWGVRHPETHVVYMQPPAPTYQTPLPPPSQPVVHNHYYVLGEPAPAQPTLPAPPRSQAVEGEWRVVAPPAAVTGKDEVRRLLAAGRPAKRLTRGE